MKRLALALLLVAPGAGAMAQERPDAPTPVRPLAPLLHAVTLGGGYDWPVSRHGIREFWRPGPSGSASFWVAVNRRVSLGIGVQVSRFRFSSSRFSTTYSGVVPQRNDILWTAVLVGGRVALLPGMRTNPFIGCSVGASRMTEALYRVIVDDMRTTYYAVGGTTRLTASVQAGTAVFLTRALALELEVRALSVHNDPDLGLAVSGLAGLRFAF